MENHPHWRLAIQGDYTGLSEATRQMRAFLASHGLGDSIIYALETTLEEAVTNAVKYGFAGVSSPRIEIVVTLQDNRVDLVIEDNAHPFDPTLVPEPGKNRTLEEMPVGGLGIHLVRSLTEGMHYTRTADSNRLHVWLPTRA
jgi:anti-sigma regulatory factor (Ser/Thr protein kinase)